jgi:TonB-linked SusC/RagA family outer membrane protein
MQRKTTANCCKATNRPASVWLTKTSRIMRLMACLLLGFSLHLSATTKGQTISYTGYKVPLTTIFGIIKQQTGYLVVYNAGLLEKTRPVDIAASNRPLEAFLQDVLNDQPLRFSIVSKTIVISEKEKEEEPPAPPLITVQGYVYDTLGRPLDRASVMVKGAKKGTQTDASGLFILHELKGDESLVISYNTFQTQTIAVNNRTNISVVLKLSPSLLDQTVVQAYGTTSRRFSVGAISTVTAEQIERQPVSNILLALQGQVPGLTVTPTGGAPGSAVKIQIRGQNTLSNSPYSGNYKPLDQPLFIIDGVPLAAQNNTIGNLLTAVITNSSSSRIPGNGVSAFGSINPADIESISVLKDADATSIYGSQGANGVILITTKKGKPGKPALNLTVNSNVNIATRKLDMMNTQQYLAIRREALVNDKVTLTPANANNYPDLTLFDSTRNVDWYDEFFNKIPLSTDVHASFSGGQQYSSFILSGGYTHTTYNFPGSFADNRLSLHSGYTYRSPNNKLTVQFITDYSYNKNNASAQPRVVAAMMMPPNYPALLDDNNNLLWRYKGLAFGMYQQYANLRQPADVQSHSLNLSSRIAYQVLPGLTISSNFGYSRLNGTSYSAIPLATLDPGSTSRSSATFTTNSYQTLNVEPQADYRRNIGAGVFSALLGGTYRKQSTYSEYLNGSNFPNDDLLGSINNAATIGASNSGNIYKYVAAYTRIGYIYQNKYILNLSGRRDGSSNFGPGRRFGNFGSVGAGWIFTEEAAFKKALPFISFGKLSGSYGTNGSDGIAPYNYQAYYGVAYSSTTLPYQGFIPYTPSNLYNPNYSWSVKKSWNASLDLGFFHDRLLINATWYRSRMYDQLIPYTLPDQVGFPNVLGNFPAVLQNNGWEFSASSTNIQTKNFSWTSTFNIALNRNKLVAFDGLAQSPYASMYKVGESTSLVVGYQFAGLNPATGLYEFYTSKGTKVSNPNSQLLAQGGDRQALFNTDPKFSGGMGHTLTYKGFSLYLFFQFQQKMARNYLYSINAYSLPGSYVNLPQEVLGNYWQKPGDVKPLQKLTTGFGAPYLPGYYFNMSSGSYSDMYYVRLKTASIYYTIPQSILKKTGIRDCRFFVNAQNLLTITNYKIGDPEQEGTPFTIPLQRTIAGGLSFNF